MTPKIIYDNLVIEVTRRCNMCCEDYCLRGCAQNVDMQKETIDKILDSVESIYELVFTGGEPSLNVPIMEYTLSELKRRRINVYSFFIATNGKEVTNNFIGFLVKMNAYCAECNDDNIIYGRVTLSKDPYHEKIPFENELMLESLMMYSKTKNWDEDRYHTVLERGLAKGNELLAESYGAKYVQNIPQTTLTIDKAYDNSDELQVEDTVCFTATGYVYAECDYEYEWDGGEFCLGNINEKPIYKILIEASCYTEDELIGIYPIKHDA